MVKGLAAKVAKHLPSNNGKKSLVILQRIKKKYRYLLQTLSAFLQSNCCKIQIKKIIKYCQNVKQMYKSAQKNEKH